MPRAVVPGVLVQVSQGRLPCYFKSACSGPGSGMPPRRFFYAPPCEIATIWLSSAISVLVPSLYN